MSTITKEWLQQAINDYESVRDELPFGLDDYQENILAALRIALASLEAEAVSNSGSEALFFEYTGSGDFYGYGFYRDGVEVDVDITEPLYTAPPAPVSVPDDVMAAMQKVARIRLDLNDFDGDKRGILDCLGDAEEALIEVVNRRAAMLQGADGNSPVIPDGWKLVPIELTGDMTNAMSEAILDDLHNVDVWRSVLAAAPQQEAE